MNIVIIDYNEEDMKLTKQELLKINNIEVVLKRIFLMI